jgi:hypothetical protein
MMASSRDRKPPGFDKATRDGGDLVRDVLWGRAVEIAKTEAAKVAA